MPKRPTIPPPSPTVSLHSLRLQPPTEQPFRKNNTTPPPPPIVQPDSYNYQPFLPPRTYSSVSDKLRDQLMPIVDEFGYPVDRFSYGCQKSRLNHITLS